MQDTELIEKVAHLEEREKSNTKRIDAVENKVENIYDLTLSVREIATEMKAMREDQNKMNERLKIIEEKPMQDYEETKKQVKKQSSLIHLGLHVLNILLYIQFLHLLQFLHQIFLLF